MHNFLSAIRHLAKEERTQNIFYASKELYGIQLFRNVTDFSNIQNIFLSYLYFYDTSLKDVGSETVSKLVLTDFIYEDAYCKYKNKKLKEQAKKHTKKDKKPVSDKGIKLHF